MPDPLLEIEPTRKPPQAPAPAGGITMLDAAALVTGGAVASVHFREYEEEMSGLTPAGWVLLVPAFAWLALTAAGPFLYLVRRFGHRVAGYPAAGDRGWLWLGLPWVVAGLLRSAIGGLTDGGREAYGMVLLATLAAATAPAAARAWRTLPRVGPTDAAAVAPPAGATTWTARIGRALVVAWPLQFAIALAVSR